MDRNYGREDRPSFGGSRGFGGGNSNFNGGNRPPAVSVGEEIDVKIEAVGEKGDGIAKKNGFVLFIPNAKAGEVVRIRVTKVLAKVGFAEVIGAAQGEPIQDNYASRPPRGPRAEVNLPPVEEQKKYEDTEDFGEE